MHRSVFLAFFLALVLANSLLAQNTLPLVFRNEPLRNTAIGSFIREGVVYASLTDLAATFHLKTFRSPETQKLDVTTKDYTLRAAAGNPFIVIFDQNRNGNVVQLQHPVLFAASAFFVPVEEFAMVFDDAMPEEISFDRVSLSLVVGRMAPAHSAYDVTGLSFDEKANGYLVRIQCSKRLMDYECWKKPIGDYTWIYMTLSDARADVGTINKVKVNDFVRQVLVFQSPKSVQLTLKVKGEISSTEPMQAEGSNDILLAIHKPSEEQLAARRARDYGRSLDRGHDRWKLDVVVIDAGHGGDDPGTIGAAKTKEKNVTLGIALKLGKLIEKQMPSVKVVYTRKTDEFIELYRRGQIANQAGGKLFISIHCNAMPRKQNSTNGFEIYLLRPGKTENAIRISERENSVVQYEQGYEKRYQELTEENFILLTMAQNAYVKYSEKFADLLQQEMGKHTGFENNGVKQAGFYVLVGASMPNVLIETAYLSNKRDEKILKSAAGQQRIAESICSAIKRYKHEYEKSLQEGKDLGSESH
ncbi:MAG: N-acetylmuramoyl-L-alanine amidase [Ignavibacteriae bacterium]|nr:N-acetylmuramoyl-L-alanine amidase [Ignavibacteria bacterium]MBI3365055.1 N-acetylmuramoyl-L-alanine amidase [Ignavibacteriota bacterium]